MKKRILTIVFAVIAIVALVVTIILCNKEKTAKYDGEFTCEVYDLNKENKLNSKEIKFNKGDTAFDLIDKNFDVVAEDSQYGKFITKIDAIAQDASTSTYISFDVNGEMSMVGITGVELEDGMVITFYLICYGN